MGYRGLLLSDPYKIDRMGCVCLIYFVLFCYVYELVHVNLAKLTKG
jgi:hypothetical protein